MKPSHALTNVTCTLFWVFTSWVIWFLCLLNSLGKVGGEFLFINATVNKHVIKWMGVTWGQIKQQRGNKGNHWSTREIVVLVYNTPGGEGRG